MLLRGRRRGRVVAAISISPAILLLAYLAWDLRSGSKAVNEWLDKTGKRSLLVIGIDSADWRLLDRLIEQGKMPVLETLTKQATTARMHSFEPLEKTKSPILWASITTGVEPSEHGVGGFDKNVRGSVWNAPALWDIAGAAGLSTAIIGMWNTYPARRIRGVMVSDYLAYGGGREKPLSGLVAPKSLAPQLSAMKIDPKSFPLKEIARFVQTDNLVKLEKKYPKEIANLQKIHAADRSYLRAARFLAESERFDLFFFYLRGPDSVSHRFWKYFDPTKSPDELSEEEIGAFGQVVPRYYEWVDEVVGEVVGWFPREYQLVVMSDHGYYGTRMEIATSRQGVMEHDPYGIFLVRSPFYEKGKRVGDIPLLKICPTLLNLLGLPPSREMPGRVFLEGALPGHRRGIVGLDRQRITTYQGLQNTEILADEDAPEIEQEIQSQLRSLGYID
ncbi:MAG: hypothetical protein GY854_31230 [Deltaproteobacteria bacterium]|nr:hypothetical protein [Deltaproteobacteria bacterium]